MGWLAVLLPFFIVGLNQVASGKPKDDENRSVKGFHAIHSGGNFHVFVTIGNTESLKLVGDAELLSKTETIVENGTLKIRSKKDLNKLFSVFDGPPVKVYIQAKQLNDIQQSGSGNIQVTNPINSPELKIKVSGSGTVDFGTKAESLAVAISGSGKVNAKGTTNKNDIHISGSGRLNATDLQAAVSSIRISGSGNADINTSKEINAAISGSGKVRYKGNVQKVNTKISGSGKVSRF